MERGPVEILSPRAIEAMRRAGRAAAATLVAVTSQVRPGVTTGDIDRWVREDTARRGGRPSQLGYHGYRHAVCTSRNEVVCHGIPRDDEVLKDGDILNVDVTTELGGYHGDTSLMVLVGEVSAEARHVAAVSYQAMMAGIGEVRPKARLGDVGAAIAEVARAGGCSVVTAFVGHGIGREMHMAPEVRHFGRRGTGLRLRPGMAFTIEPMVNLGGPDIRVLTDGWTAVTTDGSLSAQHEHTVLVTEAGVEVLTDRTAPFAPAAGADPPSEHRDRLLACGDPSASW